MFLGAKREQRSIRVKSPSAALLDVRLWGHASCLLLAAPEEGHDLRSGAIRVGAELHCRCTLGDTAFHHPQNRVKIVSTGLDIREWVAAARDRRFFRAPEETHDLRSRAGVVGAERGVARALGDAILYRPQHSIVIIAAHGDVGKRHGAGFGVGTASGTPEEGHGLRAGADAVRIEAARACAGGDAVFYRPQHRVVVVAARRKVDKFVRPCKADLDGMVSADILKGVGLHCADALAVDLDVGDSIALIRSDGEGLVSALADTDIAGGRNGAASPGGCLDGVVAIAAAAATTAAGLMIQLDLAGQDCVVGVSRREAPLIGLVRFDPGAIRQDVALVIHPFQLAVIGIQCAAFGGQRRVLQRLATGGDLGVLGLTGGSGRFDHEHEGGAGDVVVVVVARLGCNNAHRADLGRSQNAGFGINGRTTSAVSSVNAVGYSTRAGAAGGGQCQRLTIDHTVRALNGQGRLIRLVHRDLKLDVLHRVVVGGVRRGELRLELLCSGRSVAHGFAAVHPAPAVWQRHICQRLTVNRRQAGGLRVSRYRPQYLKLHTSRGERAVVLRLAKLRVHIVGSGVQRVRLNVLPLCTAAVGIGGAIVVGHASVARPVCQAWRAWRLAVNIVVYADLAVLLGLGYRNR